MNWHRTWRADPIARALADRHYSRKRVGAAQFSPPGRNLTLRTAAGDAVWVTSWPLLEYVEHYWGDCWTCTLFRNESSVLSSQLITEAEAATGAIMGEAPAGGFLTFVDAGKVRPKRDPGYCFLQAGYQAVGRTKDRGLIVLQHRRDSLPPPKEPGSFGQLELAEAA